MNGSNSTRSNQEKKNDPHRLNKTRIKFVIKQILVKLQKQQNDDQKRRRLKIQHIPRLKFVKNANFSKRQKTDNKNKTEKKEQRVSNKMMIRKEDVYTSTKH